MCREEQLVALQITIPMFTGKAIKNLKERVGVPWELSLVSPSQTPADRGPRPHLLDTGVPFPCTSTPTDITEI
jgi:hypothetical protein